jgi:phage repressor protein C with HTH and peptisase S24 domain
LVLISKRTLPVKSLELKQGSYSPYEIDSEIPQKHLDKLQLNFNVNPEWLRKGKGEMFLTGTSFSTSRVAMKMSNKVRHVVEEAAHEYQLARPVPYFDIDVSASNIEMFTDERELPTKAISIDGFEDCDFGVPVFGDSMYPTYVSGTIILVRRLPTSM